MEVQLTEDQKAFLQLAIASGRYQREEEALQEALLLWENRERRRLELLSAIDEAEASLARGEGRALSTREELANLAGDITRRGLARMASKGSERG